MLTFIDGEPLKAGLLLRGPTVVKKALDGQWYTLPLCEYVGKYVSM